MKFAKLFTFCISFLVSSSFISVAKSNQINWIKSSIETAAFQLNLTAQKLQNSSDTNSFPRSADKGKLKLVDSKDWTSGFFPGSLWYAYELTGNKKLAEHARNYTNKLFDIQYYKDNHDVGFMMLCSYGNAIRLNPNKGDSAILINSAKSLSTRFCPQVGLIRSWDKERWKFPVIIDNMMNLELLFEASKMSGDNSFRNIAISHADNTMLNHFRPDMSTYHVVSYNPENGKVETKETHQGYSDNSSWARGQAWGLYGYTVCYRETKFPRYLERAKAIASFIMNNPNIPDDLIPYWDYDAPNKPNVLRDASAAAITASALIELSSLTNNKIYLLYAEKILKTLSGPQYLAKRGTNDGFILMHSVGSIPGKFEIDTPLNYADYYYLEALKRYTDIFNSNSLKTTMNN